MIKMINADGARALCKASLPKPYEEWMIQCNEEIRSATKLNQYKALVNLDLNFDGLNPENAEECRDALATWLRDLGFKAVVWNGTTQKDNFGVVIQW